MGLFNFIKEAGKKLGIGGDDAAPAAEEVKKELDSFDLGSEKVDVAVEGDKVVLKGEVADQSIFEKAIVAVGNTLGISTVEASELKVADRSAPADPKFHTVVKGDTLWAISEKAYGNGKYYNDIFEANRPMLSDPDKIYPGQNLRIPPLA
ncbi:MAG: peptidoglycan-binding protein LysM [Rhodobiaceae bacterium]|nr:peptidoglycan-binding protein LysM [Rhodobiaceae bacterium]